MWVLLLLFGMCVVDGFNEMMCGVVDLVCFEFDGKLFWFFGDFVVCVIWRSGVVFGSEF